MQTALMLWSCLGPVVVSKRRFVVPGRASEVKDARIDRARRFPR